VSVSRLPFYGGAAPASAAREAEPPTQPITADELRRFIRRQSDVIADLLTVSGLKSPSMLRHEAERVRVDAVNLLLRLR